MDEQMIFECVKTEIIASITCLGGGSSYILIAPSLSTILLFFDHFFGERKCRLPQSGRRTAKKKMHKTIPFCISYHKY